MLRAAVRFARCARSLHQLLSAGDAIRFAWNERRSGPFEITVAGRKITLRGATSDTLCFQKIWIANEYRSPFPLSSGPLIIDAGANIGLASIYLSTQYSGAKIIAIEPNQSNFALLCKNCAGLNIELHRAALWSSAGTIEMFDAGQGHWAYAAKDDRPSISVGTVRTITIPEIIGTQHVAFLKLDIEGAEREVMLSASWLDQIDVIAIELHDRYKPGCAEAFYKALRGRNFRQEILGENIFIDLR
jgi:FkbM family methyltransferase